VTRAEAGEEVVIARDGRPVVTLTPRTRSASEGRRRIGIRASHNLQISDQVFFEPDGEIEAAMNDSAFPRE